MLLLCCFSRVRLCETPETAAHQTSHPWDSPGKNTGVGCHFLLQCMKVKSEREVAQSCPTIATPWTAAYQAPLSMGFSRQKYWSGVPLPSPPFLISYALKTGSFSPSSLWQPRGVGWRGRWEAGSRGKGHMSVYLWPIDTAVWQKPAQYCKAIIFL